MRTENELLAARIEREQALTAFLEALRDFIIIGRIALDKVLQAHEEERAQAPAPERPRARR